MPRRLAKRLALLPLSLCALGVPAVGAQRGGGGQGAGAGAVRVEAFRPPPPPREAPDPSRV